MEASKGPPDEEGFIGQLKLTKIRWIKKEE
jgi:hypothetical protein